MGWITSASMETVIRFLTLICSARLINDVLVVLIKFIDEINNSIK
jgi:hypothetical protein